MLWKDPFALENWMRANYPEELDEWELEASEYLDLYEWLDRAYYRILDEFKQYEKSDRREVNRMDETYQEWLEKVWEPYYVEADNPPPMGFCEAQGRNEYEVEQFLASVTL